MLSIIRCRCSKRPDGWTSKAADGGRRTVSALHRAYLCACVRVCVSVAKGKGDIGRAQVSAGLLGVQKEGEVAVDETEKAMRMVIDERCAAVLGVPQVSAETQSLSSRASCILPCKLLFAAVVTRGG
jgi:hypothetical protein